ncbi:U32 family peptidase [Erysipelotrichaceae bacterium OttesenSCG-928-M19]|nr:U32 family peptidase [Erysipelotrichaceae bacterium OttesenSCG-928-M19]
MIKPELLAPAGDLEKLKIAILYGADAVYIGGKQFSLRSSASNFALEDIEQGVIFAHQHQAKVYVVVNIIFHNEDLAGLKEYLQALEKIKVDGIICADVIVVKYLNQYAPSLPIHISTQQSITNSYAIKFYEKLNATRIVLARETTYAELKLLKEKSNLELEYFVHGAMCVAYSGRCMLSNYYSKRDSNRGGCSQSCRWNYNLYHENKGQLEKINTDDCYFTMSSKDLSLALELPKLIDLGISSLKIEGRMKSIYYLATIVSTYRQIIDQYSQQGYYDERLLANLSKAANRAVNDGFFNNEMNVAKQLYQNRDEHPTKEFIGYVLAYENKMIKLEQRNYFEKGDHVELFGPNNVFYSFVIDKMYDEDLNEITIARHPQQIIYLPFENEIVQHSMLRKII